MPAGAGGIVGAHRTLRLGDDDAARPRRRIDQDVRHGQQLAGQLEVGAWIERRQQFRTGVKLLTQLFQHRRIPQVFQLRLLLHTGGYGRKGPLQVLRRDGVIDQRRRGVGVDGAPGGGVEHSAQRELPLALEGGQALSGSCCRRFHRSRHRKNVPGRAGSGRAPPRPLWRRRRDPSAPDCSPRRDRQRPLCRAAQLPRMQNLPNETSYGRVKARRRP
jgi:hypothetical protein